MSRFRSGAVLSDTRFHDTQGAPTTNAPSGTISFNLYNAAYMQLDRPNGKNWVRIQEGYKKPIVMHGDGSPSSFIRPVEISINGTKLVDSAAATNIPADPNDLIGIADYSIGGDIFRRATLATGNDTASRFTACQINVGGPFRIIKMGFYTATNLNSCTSLNGKFGIYQAANHYDTVASPWKIYPNAILSFSATPAASTKYTCSWAASSVPPVIESEKFFIRSYWNTSGGGPELITRISLNLGNGIKSDRLLTYVSDSYTNPDWTTQFDYTGSVGSPDPGSSRSGVLFWFMVEPL